MAISIKKISGLNRNLVRKVGSTRFASELYTTSLLSDANLVGYYRMEGNSNDSSSSPANGSDTAITYGTAYGIVGQGAVFDGSTSKIVLGTASKFNITGNLTINAWIYLSNLTEAVRIFMHRNIGVSPDTQGYEFAVGNTTSCLQFYSNNTTYNGTTSSVSTGKWQMITVIKTSTNLAFYVNTSAQGTASSVTINGGTDPAGIGYRSSGARIINGYIDEVSIFNRAITTGELSTIYSSTIKKFAGVANI